MVVFYLLIVTQALGLPTEVLKDSANWDLHVLLHRHAPAPQEVCLKTTWKATKKALSIIACLFKDLSFFFYNLKAIPYHTILCVNKKVALKM